MTSFFLLFSARLVLLVCSGNIGTLAVATLKCVKNCVVATPAVYGPWIGACANLGDKRSRSQVVLADPVNGGTPCPPPVIETCPVVDCESHYDAWSPCNSKGKETRLVIIDRENSGGGAACPANQERLCKVDCVVRCVALHFFFKKKSLSTHSYCFSILFRSLCFFFKNKFQFMGPIGRRLRQIK